MICNAIDEVLFWDELDVFKDFYAKSTALFFPHDPKGATKFYLDFIKSQFPTKEDFIVRFERYAEVGGPLWIAGRNQFCDDIGRAKLRMLTKLLVNVLSEGIQLLFVKAAGFQNIAQLGTAYGKRLRILALLVNSDTVTKLLMH